MLNYPNIIRSGKFPLTDYDFEPNLFHKTLFEIIHNLAHHEEIQDIDEIMVAEYIESRAVTKEIIEDNEGLDFIVYVKDIITTMNIEMYYPTIRKFALLRKAQSLSIDISDICDETLTGEKQQSQIDPYSIQDLVNLFEEKIITLKKQFSPQQIREEMWAGENFESVLDKFEQTPVMGAGFNSPYETEIFRGFQKGHLILRSAKSGKGKTTRAIADLCYICCTKVWSEKKQQFINNPNYQGNGFYIHSEMDMEEELQPKFIAYIANIPLHTILDGNYTKEQRARLVEAGNILEESKIKLINMPEFTIPLLKDTIKEMVLTEKCEYGVFDYVEDNGAVSKAYKQETGAPLRQDIVLTAIVTALKGIAEDNNIGLLSMTQLNGNEDTATIIDEHCLFGSKSMKNKVDAGIICLPPTKKELEVTKYYCKKRGFGEDEINMVSHVYKGRFSKYGQNLKIFQRFDYGTGRIEDCYVTNCYNELVSVDKTYISNREEK